MSKPPLKNKTSRAVHSTISQPQLQQLQQIQVAQQVYQGPIPHPDILRGFDTLVPGTAKRLIDMAEAESLHRRKLEEQAQAANVDNQAKQLEIADYQSRVVFKSDTLGQVAGVIVSLSCIAGAVWLAIENHEVVATALAAIPTAAVVKAFFSPRKAEQK